MVEEGKDKLAEFNEQRRARIEQQRKDAMGREQDLRDDYNSVFKHGTIWQQVAKLVDLNIIYNIYKYIFSYIFYICSVVDLFCILLCCYLGTMVDIDADGDLDIIHVDDQAILQPVLYRIEVLCMYF